MNINEQRRQAIVIRANWQAAAAKSTGETCLLAQKSCMPQSDGLVAFKNGDEGTRPLARAALGPRLISSRHRLIILAHHSHLRQASKPEITEASDNLETNCLPSLLQ